MAAAAVGTAASAGQLLAAAQAQTGSPLQPAVASAFVTTSGALSPQFPATALAGETKQATLSLPQLASAPMHLADVASGAAVDVSLSGALPVSAQAVGGYLVYPAALVSGATLLHRPLPAGSEDFVSLPARPATPELDYGIALGAKVAGLRLVGGTLELLDAGGAPRLHVPPPDIVGADGVRTDGALAVSGCAFDSDPSPPWGRAVTPAGAATCTVRVTWPDTAVVYPAVLDPRWTTTGSMGTARFEHTLIVLSTGKALAVGGRSTTSGTTGLTSCELYDPPTGSWAATGALAHGRRLHTVTQLPTSSNSTTSGKVLAAGGISGSTSLSTAELYSPSAGTWIAAGTMDTARHQYTATLLPDGRVLAAGGLNGTTMLTGAALYNPASGAGSWVATTGPVPPGGIKNHTATLIQTTNTQLNNHVLLVGGNNGSATVASVYLFDPVQNAFSTLASIPSAREQATALTLPGSNGKILVTGGKNGSSVLNTAIVFDPGFSNGSWSSAGTMTSARVGHTMTLLPNSIVANGQVLVAGGSSTGSNFLSSAELYSGTSTWTATPSMPGPLSGDQAVLLSGNSVLVAGGLSASTTVQTAAYLYDASFGLGCSSGSQCASGFCVSGICCNSTCTGTCGACNLAGHLGTCTALSSGTVCRAQNGACDVAETCNGSSTTCPSDGFAASGTTCRAAADACDVAETCSGTSASCPADSKKASGTACPDDGNPCTADQCDGTHVACQHPAGNAGAVCRAQNGACDVAETCSGTSTTCPTDGFASAGTVCRAANGICDVVEACSGSSAACPADAFLPATTVCRPSSGACDVAESCTGASATCPADAFATNGTSCSDGNACTQTDTCQSGSCVGGNPITCLALDQCHAAGSCNPSTGACSNPTKPNGTTCNDGNACTQTDTCQSGSCTGGNPITCTAQDQCHTAGTCNSSTGTCSNPAAPNGTTCNDGNACTQTDTCQTGTCTGGSPVTCTAQDQCHDVGTCDQGTGQCSNPSKANGATCDDGNACTKTDTCQTGVCNGSNPVTCTAQDQCHTAGTCDPANGNCSNPNKTDGTTCNDGNACTTADACHSGSCSGATVNCMALDQCHSVGTCDSTTGVCSNPAVSDGTTCDDGNACTTSDTCLAGNCGGSQVNCSAPDQCHSAGTCDPSTGACTNPVVVDGSPCNDGSTCATGEMCTSGVCGGGTGIGCAGLVLTTSNPSPFASENILMTATSSMTDLAPGEQPTINATLTDQGLIVDIEGQLATQNASVASLTIGATTIRLEYFSTSQNQWISVASSGRSATGQALPATPANNSSFFNCAGCGVPGVTSPLFMPPETVLAAGVTANWTYFDFIGLPRSTAVLLTQASRSGSVRFVIELDSGTDGSVSLAPIDVTPLFATLPDYPLEALTVTATLDSNTPVALAATGPITDGQTSAVFSGAVTGPTVTPRSAFSDDSGYVEYLLNSAGTKHKVVVTEKLNGGSSGSPVNIALPSAVPIVDFGFQPPPAAVAGQPVHYDLDFRNDGTGVAGPLTLTYLLSGTPTGASSPPGQLVPAQSSNGSIDFTAPATLPSGPLDDQMLLTWKDRVGNVYGPMTQRSASCPIGACTSIASGETLSFSTGNGLGNQPHLSLTLSTDVAQAMAGDTIHVTAVLTNTGLQVGDFTGLETVTNTGFAPFVVQGFRQSFEYFSAATNSWIPFVAHAEDAFGNAISDPSTPDLGSWDAFPNTPNAPGVSYPNNDLQGTTINPGATAQWAVFGGFAELPPEVEQAIDNGDMSGGVRTVFQLDVSSGPPPDPTVVDVTASFGVPSAVSNLVVQAGISGTGFQLTSTDTGPLEAGQSRTYTGTAVAPLPAPPAPNTSDDTYYFSLISAMNGGYGVNVIVGGTAGNTQPEASVQNFNIARVIPILQSTKVGVPQVTAGLPAQYQLVLQNIGNVTATPVSVLETANGAQLPATVLSMSPPLDPGQTGHVTFASAAPVSTPAGPFTDDAKISWTDRNGNTYGPLGASFTTNLVAGHTEGYLLLNAQSTVPELGTADLVTATAEDGTGNPVPGVGVHFVVTGFDPKTIDLVTGADGTASFSYSAANLGKDSIVAAGSVTGVPLTASLVVTWASSVGGTPCTGRGAPLDVLLVLDGSPSMYNGDNVAAAQAASDAFIGDLDLSVDQEGTVSFSGDAELDVPLTTDATAAKSGTDTALFNWAHACDGFCGGGTNYPAAFQMALTAFQSPLHRDNAQPVVVFISDGGNTGGDYSSQLAALKAFGVRIIVLALGSNVDVAGLQHIASSPNDYFYAPTISELAWAYANIVQDTCSTTPPLVTAGGNQGLYDVRLPNVLTLQGEAHGSGPRGDLQLTTLWTELSGPAPVTFSDATSPVTQALFTDPGTYVLQLEATDGFLSTADQATVTVDPAASLTGANLLLALSSAGPLTIGSPETILATLTDAQSHPISNFVVQFTVTGANPGTNAGTTNATGVATFVYAGAVPGTDVLQATAIGGTAQLASATASVSWTAAQSGPAGIVSQGWIGSPAQRARVTGLVPVTVAPGVTVASSTVSYWSVASPGNVTRLAANATGGPGATLAALDTTTLRNGNYIIDVNGTDDQGSQQDNEILVAVSGDYKPGRVIVDITDLAFPVAGIPITIGRHYDSLNKDKLQDFGFGWSLTVGHPDLEVDQANDVTITLPDGRRSTFLFELLPAAVGPVVLGFIATPLFVPEPGVFGTLTADGCSPLVFDPTSDNINPICFASILDPTQTRYAPTTYRYTDPYGTVYTMGADGALKTVQDRSNNTLTFTPTGITSSTGGRDVVFVRDAQGRITQVLGPNEGDFFNTREANTGYSYDAAGNLIEVDHPNISVFLFADRYGYDGAHRLTSATDADGHPISTATYDDAGRLATNTDGAGNVTKYAYDIAGHTTTTTYPDTGVTVQTFDGTGMVLSVVDPLGHTTSYEYDANRNQTKRTNALGEVTKYTYDANGNRTSSTNVSLDETTTSTYGAFSQLLTTTSPTGNTTTIAYDAAGLPTTFTDSMGLLATFTSTEHGLPSTATDATGNVISFGYDASGDLTQRTDRLGRIISYGYTGSGRKTTTTDPRGGVTTYFYDADLRFTGTTNPLEIGRAVAFDPAGNVQEVLTVRNFLGIRMEGDRAEFFTYDANNRPTAITHGDDSSQIQQTCDFRGNLLTRTDELGRVTSYVYDLGGRQIQTNYPDGTLTKQSFDALGRPVTKTDERTNTVTYGYQPGCDCSDRLTTITDALGRTTSFSYDGMSQKTSMTDANNHQTIYHYDLRGHLTETDYADGTSTLDVYDALGRRSASQDQMGKATQYGYDAEGQLTSVTDPLGHVTRYGYDPNGNLTSVTDGNNHSTTNGYDAANRNISRTLPLGMTETFAYDVNDNIVSHTDFRGKTATYGFDQRYPTGRPTSKVPDPSLNEPTVSYTYYANGPRETMTDASGFTSYTYDLRDRLQTKATPEGTLAYAYDASGNVASIDSSNADGSSVAYTWDPANQLSTVTDNRLEGTTAATYTATGRPSTLSQPNGVGVTYGYDSLDRVTSMAWRKGPAPAFAGWQYGYNSRGQRLSSTDVTGRVAAYDYDAASELTSETITGAPSGPNGNGALKYVNDAAGNRLSRTSTLVGFPMQTFSYDPNDELTTDGYDQNGNTTSSEGHPYTYDFENRLISNDGGTVVLVYDGDGNRVAKTAGGVTTQYLVDDLNPTGYLQVMDEISAGAVQVRYTYGNTLVSQTRNPSSAPATSFYGYDAHGNIAFLTDGTGAQTDTYIYDAWGNIIEKTGSTTNTRLYDAQELDPDLQLLNLRARYYSPSRGRFLSTDPLQPVAGAGGLYQYGSADPVNQRDPTGLQPALEYAIPPAAVAVPIAIPAVVVVTAPVITATEVGILVYYGALITGGAFAALALKIRCQVAATASALPLTASGGDPCSYQLKSCETEYPTELICGGLSNGANANYTFQSPDEALQAFMRSTNEELYLARPEPTEKPPCKGKGTHWEVFNGFYYRAGSIVCCPCCQDTFAGPMFPMQMCSITQARKGFPPPKYVPRPQSPLTAPPLN